MRNLYLYFPFCNMWHNRTRYHSESAWHVHAKGVSKIIKFIYRFILQIICKTTKFLRYHIWDYSYVFLFTTIDYLTFFGKCNKRVDNPNLIHTEFSQPITWYDHSHTWSKMSRADVVNLFFLRVKPVRIIEGAISLLWNCLRMKIRMGLFVGVNVYVC